MVFVWWAAVVKSISAIFTFIFGPDYRQAMYGKSMKKNIFLLDKNITVTNHGSFGTVPKKVLEARWQFQVIQLKIINLQCDARYSGHPTKFFLQVSQSGYENLITSHPSLQSPIGK